MPIRLWFALSIATLTGYAQPAGCAMDRAVRLHQTGDFPGAIREYQACIAAEPARVEARSNLGAVLAKLGRYQDAIDQYQAALRMAPRDLASRLRFNLALAYYKSFQIPEAVAEFETLRGEQPADLNLALLLADCRLRTGDFQAAIDVLTPLEASQPDQPALDYVLGMALLRTGRIPEGQARVDRILRRGESAEGRFLLGASLFMAGNFPGAVAEFSKAAALDPNLPSLQSYYGQALLFTGDADGAAVAFRKELAANPNDFDANFQLASILAHRGKPDEARPLLARAVQVRPGSAEAREALGKGFPADQPTQADPGIAVGSRAPAIGTLDLGRPTKPVVLVFGSYTCPKLRSSAAALKRIAEQYRDRIDFRLVYIREAHAQGGPESQWQSTINIKEGVSLAPARTLPEKQEHAALCLRKLELPFPAVIDGMDGAAETAYQAWPSRLYLVGRDGKVAFSTRLGELEFRPADLETAIREILSKTGVE
uniref:Tetratricopeptide TPR_2 repeat protein n=1 Tax=Solibacter usitatus (strain Ellin6076) TaxID=234267 RepID=Q021C3_SOLUE